jgi:hypothetical protein
MKLPVGVLPSPYDIAVWGQSRPLLVDEVIAYATARKIKYEQLQPSEDHTDVALHTRRAAFFYLSSDKTPLQVRVHRTPSGEPYLWVEDGVHRLAGAIARGDVEIEAQYNRAVIDFLRKRNAMNETATNTESNLRQAIIGGLLTALKGMIIPVLVGFLVYLFTYPAGALSCHFYAKNKHLEGHYEWWECYIESDGQWYTKLEYQSVKIGGRLVVDKVTSVLEAADK